jgi:hypothetical protein
MSDQEAARQRLERLNKAILKGRTTLVLRPIQFLDWKLVAAVTL